MTSKSKPSRQKASESAAVKSSSRESPEANFSPSSGTGKKEKEIEVIVLSSDSDSDLSGPDGGGALEQPAVAAAATASTPARRKPTDGGGGDAEAAPSQPVDGGESPASKQQRKLAVRVKRDDGPSAGGDQGPKAAAKTAAGIAAPDTAAAAASGPRGSHVRFGDDDGEREQFFTPTEAPVRNPLDSIVVPPPPEVRKDDEDEGDEDEDDDDAPPEAVSSHSAAAQTMRLVEGAAKAVERQAVIERQKRQRRDVLFKTQAKKRALEEAAEKAKEARKAAKRKVDDVDGEDDGGHDGEEPRSNSKRAKPTVPALLPEEFLQSDDEEDEEGAAEQQASEKRPKKIRFETAERIVARQENWKGPADQRVGGTVYRVLGRRSDERLAPVQGKYTGHQKRALLARGRVAVRRKGGFLVGK